MTKVVKLPPGGGLRADGSVVGGWWHEEPGSGRLTCDLCPRACSLKPGDRGFCFVRQNVEGEVVLTTYGRSTGFCIDPIEKKPLHHFYPGTSVLSFGTAGCNLGCKFCQNWDISKSREVERLSEQATPEAIAEAARVHGCRSVAFTYNDPIVWAEYAIDTAKACRARGVKTVAVTAGYIAPAARGPFFEHMDAANVDLKAFTEEFYHQITYSHIQPVLDTLAWLKAETDCWLEVTNLMVPGANDSDEEVRRMAGWLLEHCGAETPVHFTAFHPDFRMKDRPATPRETLVRAYEIARDEGLKHVYTGNVDDPMRQGTDCARCGGRLIERNGYELGAWRIVGGACGRCGTPVAGRFDAAPGDWGRRRQPIEIATFATAVEKPRTRPDPPVLTLPQREAVLDAASEYVQAAIVRRPARLEDPGLAGAADLMVTGAYVTLERGGHLRACTGLLGRRARLAEVVRQASFHTATADHRLPPISPTELPFLDVSVNLLFGLRRLEARGRDRAAAVEVGRHGLRVHRGEAGGLLLPSVAADHGWDPETFLRHVCRKAGLPSTAWEDDDTNIEIFDSLEFSRNSEQTNLTISDVAFETDDDLPRRLAAHAEANVRALARGMAPSYYLAGAADGHVAGLTLTVDGPIPGGPWHFAQLALRPGVPLQATLAALGEAAARALPADRRVLDALRVGVTVLEDPALHGHAADPDLRGFDPARRALLAVDGERSAWTFDPGGSPKDLLERLLGRLAPHAPARTGLFSLAVRSTEPSVVFDTVPRPVSGPPARPAAVAGAFYPSDPSALDALVRDLLGGSERRPERWRAAMVPHAGLIYSGKVAAAVFNRLEFPERIVVIGPKHTRQGADWAVAPHEVWTLPGGPIASDPAFARALAEAIPGLQLDAAAHRKEHAVEVELPFLAHLAPDSKVVGIAVGSADWPHCQRFAEGLAAAIGALEEPPLLLISSDMNHFASDRETRLLDARALEAIETLDPERLLTTVQDHDISMCGVIPAAIVMETLRRLGGLTRVERAAYATSGEVTGDPSRVVGYAGMLFR